MGDGLQFDLEKFLQVYVQFEYPYHLFELKAEHDRVHFGLVAFLLSKQPILLKESRKRFAVDDASFGQLSPFNYSSLHFALYDSVVEQVDEPVLELHLVVLFDGYYIDVADVVYGGKIAEEEIGHKFLLYFPVLP